jgi:hypothetical protein
MSIVIALFMTLDNNIYCLLDTLLHKFLDVPLQILSLTACYQSCPTWNLRPNWPARCGASWPCPPLGVSSRWGGVGHGLGAAAVQVAEVEGENLQLVGCEVAVVPQNLVVAGPTGPLDPLVAEQVEVALCHEILIKGFHEH